MALSPQYIAATDLCEYFVDKDTGLPLAGGQIQFWVDGARTTPKLVYQLNGDPTNSQGGGYTYAPLPNPITLSSTGTIQDNSGNNTPVYYYPYDAQGQLELYYIVVLSAEGVVQFTREGWPSDAIRDSGGSGDAIEGASTNQVSNPQFIVVNFDVNTGLEIQVSGVGSSTYNIAPGWDLTVSHSGSGSVNLARIAVDGNNNYATNPPYFLRVSSTPGITGLVLKQRFEHSPALWGQTAGGVGGWVAGTLLLGANSFATMTYVPSVGVSTQILDAANVGVVPNTYSASAQLPSSISTDDGDNGYVELQISLAVNRTNFLSSIQLISAPTNPGVVSYFQDSTEKQMAQLFSYYGDGLLYKPTKSYLVGWDFSLNPAQINGDSGSIPAGTNVSAYAWDQTIIYSGVSGAISYSRASDGSLRVSASSNSSFALIQYLPASEARRLLNQDLSSMVSAITNNTTALNCSVSLWYTTSIGNLPSLAAGTYQSIVQTLDANGMPATFNNPSIGSWVQVPRASNLNATFGLASSPDARYNNYGFNGWSLNGDTAVNTATYFAIVIGVGELPAGKYVDFSSISLVPGQNPTIPAPQSANEVLMDCQHYYWKTYNFSDAAGSITTTGQRIHQLDMQSYGTGGSFAYPITSSFNIVYPTLMRKEPVITLYSPALGTADALDILNYTASLPNASRTPNTIQQLGVATSSWTPTITSTSAFYYNSVGVSTTAVPTGLVVEAYLTYQLVADTRLGIIN